MLKENYNLLDFPLNHYYTPTNSLVANYDKNSFSIGEFFIYLLKFIGAEEVML